MKQARYGRIRWRLGALSTGLVLLVTLAVPAQAGLGDLLDDLIDPIGDIPIVGDITEPVVDPIVDDVLEPVAGSLVDPIADQILAPVLTPVIDTVVAPVVEEVLAPIVNGVVPPVTEIVPPIGETFPPLGEAILPTGPLGDEATGPFGYPGEVLVTVSGTDAGASTPHPVTNLESLRAALELQSALVETGTASIRQTQAPAIDRGWLDGLTMWLRDNAGGLFNLLALPIRLLALLVRALLTAGSGLIAPLSMLFAYTAYGLKDRRWARVRPGLNVRSLLDTSGGPR